MTNASSLTPPSTTDSNGVKKRRSRVEKLAVWLLIAALGCVAAWEGTQRWGYNQTLSQLQSRIQQGDKADSQDLTLAEARLLVHGWPVETIAPRNLGKDVELKWRSLFKEFRIQIQLGQQDLVLSLRASGDPDEPSEPVPSIEPLVSAAMLKAHYLTELPYRQIGNAGLSQSDTPMLLLDASEPRYVPNVSSHVERGVLVRELGRQALIIAASEELALPTRDGTLSETFPTSTTPVLRPFGVMTTIDEEYRAQITVYRYRQQPRGSTHTEELRSFALPLTGDDPVSQLATALEPLFRNEFSTVLREAGYSGSPRPFQAEGALPDGMEQRVSQYEVVSQFLILRDLRAEINKQGESIPRLAALARAYAHLGTLTEALWSPDHKAFKARALLYAERAVNKAPGQAEPLWSRAYVRALVGLPTAALQDLQAARQAKTASKTPDWLPVIEAFCKSDTAQLEALSKTGSATTLATYLQMLAADLSSNVPHRYAAAEKMLLAAPDCLRAWDVMARDTRLGVVGRVAQVLDQQLAAMSNLPEPIQALLPAIDPQDSDDLDVHVKRLRALLDLEKFQSDTDEPRLAILKHLIQELSFTLARGTLRFRRSVDVDGNDIIQQVHPLVHDHPFAKFIGGHNRDPVQAFSQIDALSREIDVSRIDFIQEPFFYYLASYKLNQQLQNLRQKALEHSDPVLRDLAVVAKSEVADEHKQQAARMLLKVATSSPVSAAASIRYNWAAVKDKAVEWEKTFNSDLDCLQALAQSHGNDGKLDIAARLLQRQLTIMPDFNTANELAEVYRDQDDLEQWKATLDNALKIESLGLEDAQVRVALARYHMARGEWDVAKVYADAAAASYAGWALSCAAECYEGSGDWAKSEEFHQAISERYENDYLHWYLWCQSTGHGDVNAARELAKPRVDHMRTFSGAAAYEVVAVYSLMEGSYEEAAGAFYMAFGSPLNNNLPDSYYALHAALIADQLGKPEIRDQAFQMCFNKEAVQGAQTLELARLFRRHLANDDKQPLDPVAVEWILHRADSLGAVTNLLYFVGKYHELRGHKAEARSYFERAAGSADRWKYNCVFAAQSLRKLGFELPPPHRPVFAPELMRAFHLVLRGNKEREEGNIEFAQRLYETALQASPNYTAAIFQRARLANTQQRWKDALVDYNRLLELLPGDAICHLLRGRVFEIQGDHAAAIADYEAALRTDPRNGSAHNNLTFLYSACVDPKYRDAAKAIEHAKALQTCDDQPKWSRQAALGVAHGALGEFDEAYSQTAASLQKAPSEWQERLSQRRDLFQKRQPYTRSGEWWR